MAKPTNKLELKELAEKNYTKLNSLIDSLSEENQNKEFFFKLTDSDTEAHWKRDKSIKDVLMHLYEWHMLLLEWINSNNNNKPKQFLMLGYTWKTYGEMNMIFYERNKNISLKDARKKLDDSHKEVLMVLENQNDDLLFSKGAYSFVGGSTLGQYFISNTSSHYDWAIKKIKRHIKSLE